jgi:4'-phosphopantetheinyl transferase EntD
VVARRSQCPGLGLDVEIVGAVGCDIWPEVFVPAEEAWLNTLGRQEQAEAAALLFSAKESFYKFQYGLTGQWLEFGDVAVEAGAADAGVGTFAVRPQRDVRWFAQGRGPAEGRFAFAGGRVITAMALPAR